MVGTGQRSCEGNSVDQAASKINRIDHRYTQLTAERDRIVADLQQEVRFDNDSFTKALQFRQDVVEGLKGPTLEDKFNYLELLRVAITVKDQKAIIRCALPIDPVDFDFRSF